MKPRLPNRFRRGAATVEFAVCAPVLFMTVFGIIEFSRALQLQQSVRQAAFEGARAGVTLDAATSDVTSAVSANLAAVGISNATVTVTPNPLSYTSPTVTVTVSAAPASSGWLLRFFNQTSAISSTISLVREVQAISVPSDANPNAEPASGSSSSGDSSSGSSSGSGSSGSGSSGSGSSGSGSSGGGSSGGGSSGGGSSGGGWGGGWWGGGGWW